MQSNKEEVLTQIEENGTIKTDEWANYLPPRGQIDLPKGVSKSRFIQQELKVDKLTAERYQDAIEKYTGSTYSEIRAYLRGEKEGATEDYKEYLQGLSDSLETYIKRAPRWNGGETFRGIGLTDEQLKTFTVSSEHDMLGVSSWSSEAMVAIGRANDMAYLGDSKAVVFHCITQNKGTAIHHLSSAGGEAGEYEVHVSMEARFKVIKSSENGRIIHIYLEEI